MKPSRRRDEPSKEQLDYYNALRAGHEAEMAPLGPERYQKRYRQWRRWRMFVYLAVVSACSVGMYFAIKWILWYKDLLEKQMTP